MTHLPPLHLGGLVLGSADPDRLAAWYRAAFTPDSATPDSATPDSATPDGVAPDGGPVLLPGGGRLIFDRRGDLAPVPPEPGRILVNFYVPDIDAVSAHLDTLGAHWIRPVQTFGPGRIATVADPDGNYVQIIQLTGGAGVRQ